MLLDPETLDLAQGIEAVLADVPAEHAEQVKPELFQSVLEVATTPCPDVADGDRAARRPAPAGPRDRRAQRDAARRGRDAPVRPLRRPADRRSRRATASWSRSSASSPSGSSSSAPTSTSAIDSADKAIYVADGIRRHLPLLLALSAELAVLGGSQHRPDVGAHADLPGLPAVRASRPTTGAGRSTRAGSGR